MQIRIDQSPKYSGEKSHFLDIVYTVGMVSHLPLRQKNIKCRNVQRITFRARKVLCKNLFSSGRETDQVFCKRLVTESKYECACCCRKVG